MAYLIADLKAITTDPTPQFKSVMVLGATAIDDGGGGVYHWNAASTNAGDDAEWVVPTDNPTTGRWQRITKNVESYATTAQGALADTALQPGDVDDTPVDAATTAPVSSNWAFDHAASTSAHGGPYQPVRTVVTESGTTHTNAAGDRDKWIRFTGTAAKTFTISSGVAAATDVWAFFNAGATGNIDIASSGMTLTGNLIFAPLKGGIIYFTSSSAADVIGGTAT